MKIAICLSGHARSFRETAISWEPLRNKHDVSFFATLWNETDFDGPTWWSGTRDVQPFTDETQSEFRELFKPVALEVHDRADHPPYKYTLLDDSSVCKPGDIEQQWHLIKRCNELCFEYGDMFDLIVRSRPDVEIELFEPVFPAENEIVCTRRINNHRPLCDVMFYGQPIAMAQAVSLANKFPNCLHWLKQHNLIPEDMLAEHFRRIGLTSRVDPHSIYIRLVRPGGDRQPLSEHEPDHAPPDSTDSPESSG